MCVTGVTAAQRRCGAVRVMDDGFQKDCRVYVVYCKVSSCRLPVGPLAGLAMVLDKTSVRAIPAPFGAPLSFCCCVVSLFSPQPSSVRHEAQSPSPSYWLLLSRQTCRSCPGDACPSCARTLQARSRCVSCWSPLLQFRPSATTATLGSFAGPAAAAVPSSQTLRLSRVPPSSESCYRELISPFNLSHSPPGACTASDKY